MAWGAGVGGRKWGSVGADSGVSQHGSKEFGELGLRQHQQSLSFAPESVTLLLLGVCAQVLGQPKTVFSFSVV